jgi:fumarate reductase subunit C
MTPTDPKCVDLNNPACEFDPDLDQPNVAKLTHYTIIFQAFVCMQIFNEINARKLGEREFNVFSGFFNNPLFLLILVSTLTVQYFMVQYGGASVRTIPISDDHHLICLAIGAGCLIWGIFVKLVPSRLCRFVKVKEEPPKDGKISIARSIR